MIRSEGITELLLKWNEGDATSLEELMPLVYNELRQLAARYLKHERANHTLQPTALVNEAYLRLVDQQKVEWQNRAQFFGLAARVMRNILIDHARGRQAVKRGGHNYQISFATEGNIGAKPQIEFLAVHEALERLEALDPQKARIIELRFFGGLSIDETAVVIGVGHATVERDWKLARAWLRLELE